MGIWTLEAVQEEEASLEEVRRTITGLKERQKSLVKISHTWNTKYRNELRNVHRLRKEKDDHLKIIQSQLLVFETYLQKTKTEVENLVKHKDDIIKRQHQLICSLALALVKRNGQEDLMRLLPGIKIEGNVSDNSTQTKDNDCEFKNNSKNVEELVDRKKGGLIRIASTKSDLESLNDSDSAIMMEDAYDSLIVFPTEKGEVKVMRSVSDALEIISRGSSSINNNKNTSLISSQNFLRRNGSISSTPSGSSEESDNSPPSTLTKGMLDHQKNDGYSHMKDSNSSKGKIRSSEMSSVLPLTLLSARLSPFEIDSYTKSSSCITNFPSVCPDNGCPPYMCQHNNDYATCQFCCHSGSTTPLVSPAASPSSSLSTTPSASPVPMHPSAILKTRYRPNYDSDATLSNGESEEDDDEVVNLPERFYKVTGERKSLFGSFEKLNLVEITYLKKKPKDEINPVSYNRVMSNHRSVTKPKDVKYKRINKAKSRSLEELRGKLKLYDGKQTILVDPGQSEA